MDIGKVNYLYCYDLFNLLYAHGVEQVVISPGSRSTPLVLAAAQHPHISTHIVLDERSAGFFAIGLAKSTCNPVVLVCTSGTAPANWHPAVLEADAGQVPLILLSADRPAELRGCGANQTTDQVKLFGDAVRLFHEVPPPDEVTRLTSSFVARCVRKTLWPLPGPVHLNIQFREPLLPDGEVTMPAPQKQVVMEQPIVTPSSFQIERVANIINKGNGLIVCGWGNYPIEFPHKLLMLADALQVPICADPLANLRAYGKNVLAGYDSFLKSEVFSQENRPDWVLRFGALPVSKSLATYLSGLKDTDHFVVENYAGWQDPLGNAQDVINADLTIFCDTLKQVIKKADRGNDWLACWRNAEAQVKEIINSSPLPPEAHLIRDIAKILPAQSTFFCGNSTPIRHLDSFLPSEHNGFQIVCNRGLSGIDGCVSSVMGIAAGKTTPVVALLGDLTITHDLGALGLAQGRNVTLVVINNGGGGIFEYLSQANLDRALFEQYWLTPSTPDLAVIAKAYDCQYYEIADVNNFAQSLQKSLTYQGCSLIEVKVNRRESVEAHKTFWKKIVL